MMMMIGGLGLERGLFNQAREEIRVSVLTGLGLDGSLGHQWTVDHLCIEQILKYQEARVSVLYLPTN